MTEQIDREFLVTENRGTILENYDLDKKALGEGAYGSVTRAVNKSTKAVRACKAMAKKNIKNEKRFHEEIAVMKRMDHPNIIRLYETFEDHKNIYLIMELCTGGELFDKVVAAEHLSEKTTAHIMKQMLGGLYYLHEHHIMHRDLKPENFLMASQDKDAALKMIDFGLAAKFQDGQKMTTKAGTPYYVAPQVLKGSYNEKCDIWSAGVIMFIMMSGYPPFYGEKDAEILAQVKKGSYAFPTMEEDGIEFSENAKNLIKKMLTMDEAKRPSAKECLTHEWLNLDDAQYNMKIDPKVMKNFKSFHGTAKFKKLALTAIAAQLNESEIKALKETFQALDENGDGTVTLVEIKQACKKGNVSLPANFEELFAEIDTDKSGVIDYTEFIAATMDSMLVMREDLCWSAFRVFDEDGDGKITGKELALALVHADHGIKMPEEKVAEIMNEFDTNKDGVIDFQEFCAMLRKKDMKVQK